MRPTRHLRLLGSSLFVAVATVVWLPAAGWASEPRPNILWITAEDIGPHLGCYGDAYADTPHLDRLAARGTIYSHAWSNAPVCAPARTAIITGVYPTSTGSQHMRSLVEKPRWMAMYPELLRKAGYYCTNHTKEDYNLRKTNGVWDDSSRTGHWKNRPHDKPFFAIFNLTATHESAIRRPGHTLVHDPAHAPLPAYHPDTPEVRHDWAQYYDNITTMDSQAGRILAELDDAGLRDDTIVFFYGDHGSGMTRSKYFPYNSGLQVPLIVVIPEKFRHLASADYCTGGKSERLVAFVDLAPTLLSLVDVEPPDFMQGHAFLGTHEAPPQPYLYGFRGRIDERYDMMRSVSDGRYVYIRNYMPHLVCGQFMDDMFNMPTARVWKQLYDSGKLTPEQSHFWATRPIEELYDLQNDPDEVHNLAESPEHQEILTRLRTAQQQWCLDICDLGFLPEPEIAARSAGSTPYEMGHDPQRYPIGRIMATAELASGLEPEALPKLIEAIGDPDSGARYWAVLGIQMRGQDAVAAAHEELLAALNDKTVCVQIAAAGALGQYGNAADVAKALPLLVDYANFERHGVLVAMTALTALDAMDANAAPAIEQIKALPKQPSGDDRRRAYGIPWLIQKILADLR